MLKNYNYAIMHLLSDYYLRQFNNNKNQTTYVVDLVTFASRMQFYIA
jgi:hypothetical protein